MARRILKGKGYAAQQGPSGRWGVRTYEWRASAHPLPCPAQQWLDWEVPPELTRAQAEARARDLRLKEHLPA